jgi:hypothetical protein
MEPEGSLPHSQEPATCPQRISPGSRLCVVIRNLVISYGEELLAPRPTLKLEGHPLSAVRDWLFNVFAATLHIRRPFLHPQPEDAPCRGDRDTLITVTGTHLSRMRHTQFINYLDPVCSAIAITKAGSELDMWNLVWGILNVIRHYVWNVVISRCKHGDGAKLGEDYIGYS